MLDLVPPTTNVPCDDSILDEMDDSSQSAPVEDTKSAVRKEWVAYRKATGARAKEIKTLGRLSLAVEKGLVPESCLAVPLADLRRIEESMLAPQPAGTRRAPGDRVHVDTPMMRGVRSYLNPIKFLKTVKLENPAGGRPEAIKTMYPLAFEVAVATLSLPSTNAGEERVFSVGKAVSVSDGCPGTVDGFEARCVMSAFSATDKGGALSKKLQLPHKPSRSEATALAAGDELDDLEADMADITTYMEKVFLG